MVKYSCSASHNCRPYLFINSVDAPADVKSLQLTLNENSLFPESLYTLMSPAQRSRGLLELEGGSTLLRQPVIVINRVLI